MRGFDERLLRLKRATGLLEDQEVASLLGMTKAAFADRKKRGSFPEDKLLALAATRPELGLDPQFVLSGEPMGEPVRTASLAQVMRYFEWTVTEFARKLGMSVERGQELRAGLDGGTTFRLTPSELGMLVEEFRVRREFLQQGTPPVLRPADETDALERRVRSLEDQVRELKEQVSEALGFVARSPEQRSRGKRRPR